MVKKLAFCIAAMLFLGACASKNTYSQVNQVSKSTQCFVCESKEGFEGKIKGLFYVSDIGIQCCANKRTMDTGLAIKKIYLHRFYDLREEKKGLIVGDKKYLVNLQFNAVFYEYLKQELRARHIEVLDNNSKDSPYVSKVDLSFIDFSARADKVGLNSRLVGVLSVKDINRDKKFTLRTKQDVAGFSDLKDINFYTHLLIKQMANKAASLISEL